MSRKFLETLDQEGGDVVPKGTYTVEVVDANASLTQNGNDRLWLDLKIVGGPDDGRVTSVGFNVPDDDSSRGAKFHFKKKMRGFTSLIAEAKPFSLPDDEVAAAIATSIFGATVEADLDQQGEDAGDYAGSQELVETRQIPGQAAAKAAPAPAAAPAETKTDPAPAPTEAEVAELRAKLAALEEGGAAETTTEEAAPAAGKGAPPF